MTSSGGDRYRPKHLRLPGEGAEPDAGGPPGAPAAPPTPRDVSVRRVEIRTGPARRAAVGASRHAGILAKSTTAAMRKKLAPPKLTTPAAHDPTLRVQTHRVYGRTPLPNTFRQMWNPLREVQDPERLVMIQPRSLRALPRLLWLPALILTVAVVLGVAAWGLFWPVEVVCAGAVVVALVLAGLRHLAWLVSYYLVTTDRVFFIEGALRRKVVSVPLGAISQVNFEQSVWELPYDWGKIQIRAPNQDPRTEQFRYVQHAPDFYRALNRQILNRSHPGPKQPKLWPPLAAPHVPAGDRRVTGEIPLVPQAPTFRPPAATAPPHVRDTTAEFAPVEAGPTDA